MARHVITLTTSVSINEAFALLSDMRNASEWDPNVQDVQLLTKEPIRKGSKFRVTVTVAGRPQAMEYTVSQFVPPHKVVLAATTPIVSSVDTISLQEEENGCTVTYDADLTPRPLFILFTPLIAASFAHIVAEAEVGLRRRLQA